MERLKIKSIQEPPVPNLEKPIWVGYQKYYFQEMQHIDRSALKKAISSHDKEMEKKLRERIRKRKKGPKGLRALDTLTSELNKKYKKTTI